MRIQPIIISTFYPLLSIIGILIAPSPTRAEVPLTWGSVKSSLNRVELTSSTGAVRRATPSECFCLGDTLTTDVTSRAEVQFNDGSVVRLGETAKFKFFSHTRNYQLLQGTALLLLPPGQGRSFISTPNTVTGIQDAAVVVRYVPSRNLTVVMTLSDTEVGPVILTPTRDGRDYALAAGQMAFINEAGIQVVEFDLYSFYETSDLVADLNLADPAEVGQNDPFYLLRSNMLQALNRQDPFLEGSSILDPATISNDDPSLTIFGVEQELPSLTESTEPDSLSRYEQLPPGIVAPPSIEPGSGAGTPIETPDASGAANEPITPLNPPPETPIEPTVEPLASPEASADFAPGNQALTVNQIPSDAPSARLQSVGIRNF